MKTLMFLGLLLSLLVCMHQTSRAAEPLTFGPFPLSEAVATSRPRFNSIPFVAFREKGGLAIWNSMPAFSGSAGLMAAQLGPRGELLSSFSSFISRQFNGVVPYQAEGLVPLGEGYLAMWLEAVYVEGRGQPLLSHRLQRLDAMGQPVGPVEVLIVRENFTKGVLVGTGNAAWCVWLTLKDSSNSPSAIAMQSRRLAPTGSLSQFPNQTWNALEHRMAEGPRTAVNGANFLVVWDAFQKGNQSERDLIMGATEGGNGLFSQPFPIIRDPEHAMWLVDVSPWGDGFALTYLKAEKGANSYRQEIRVARLSARGELIGEPLLVRPVTENTLFYSTRAAGGSSLNIQWEESGGNGYITHSRVLSPQGVLTTPPPINQPFNFLPPSLFADGAEGWLMALPKITGAHNGAGFPSEIAIQLLDSGGMAREAARQVSFLSHSTKTATVAPLGEGYVCAWEDDRDFNTDNQGVNIYARRFSRTGEPLDEKAILIARSFGDDISPAIASVGNKWLVVWKANGVDQLQSEIYGRLMEGGLAVTEAGPIVSLRGHQRAPSVAAGPGGFLVVCRTKHLSPNDDIMGTLLSPEGKVITPEGFLICDAPDHQEAPAVAANSQGYLVVWRDDQVTANPPFLRSSHIYGAWLPKGSAPAETRGFPIMSGFGADFAAPEVAASGEDFLVVARSSFDIHASRVSGLGQVLDRAPISVVDIPATVGFAREPVVAPRPGGGWLVGWLSTIHGEPSGTVRSIEFSTISPEGRLGNPLVRGRFGGEFHINIPPYDNNVLSLAPGSGGGFFVASVSDDSPHVARGWVLYPGLDTISPSISGTRNELVLRGKTNSLFTRDSVQGSTDLRNWDNLDTWRGLGALDYEVENAGNELRVRLRPRGTIAPRFFRFHAR